VAMTLDPSLSRVIVTISAAMVLRIPAAMLQFGSATQRIDMGVHEGRVNHVRVLFLHNESVFPRPYPALDAAAQVRVLAAFGQGCLELLCQWNINPAVVVSNDWFTSLCPLMRATVIL